MTALDKIQPAAYRRQKRRRYRAIFKVRFEEGLKVVLYSHPDFMPRFFITGNNQIANSRALGQPNCPRLISV